MAVKFLCENCKSEVSLDVDNCPYCGKRFYSVYCPRCKKEGIPREFANGCPQCGYLKENYKSSRGKGTIGGQGKQFFLPRWCYSAAIVLLTVAIIGMLILLLLGMLP